MNITAEASLGLEHFLQLNSETGIERNVYNENTDPRDAVQGGIPELEQTAGKLSLPIL